jgi:myosin protein heavy chain
MQASFEAEARGKGEALKGKKKLEADINELEVGLDGANRGRAEAEKNIKKLQQQVRDIQQVMRHVNKHNIFKTSIV